jgi:hypothetical protein
MVLGFCEINVTIKDDEKRLNKKFPVYEIVTTDENDPIIKQCIEETLKNFDGTPDDIKVIITMEIQ